MLLFKGGWGSQREDLLQLITDCGDLPGFLKGLGRRVGDVFIIAGCRFAAGQTSPHFSIRCGWGARAIHTTATHDLRDYYPTICRSSSDRKHNPLFLNARSYGMVG